MELLALEPLLLALAARCGVTIRCETFDRALWGDLPLRGGGLCWLHGQPVLVLDAALPLTDRVALLAEALARFDLESLAMPPAVRELIARRGRRQKPPRLRLVG